MSTAWSRRVLLFSSLSVLALLGAGCNDSGDSTTQYNIYGKTSTIAQLTSTTYTDYDPLVTGSESSNIKASLENMGYVVEPFTEIDAATISTAINGKRTLLIPELDGDLDAALADDARAVIVNFVSGGGTLITTGTSANNLTLLNDSFGFALTVGSKLAPYTLDTTAAAGTPFEGAQNELPYNNGTSGLTAANLPVGALAIYTEDNVGDAIVAVFPYGSGRIVYLGYDWYDAIPIGTQGGGWNDILSRAAQQW